MNKKLLDRYFRKLRRKLPCSRKEKNRIIADLRANAEIWLEAHPNAVEWAFYEAFGTPEAVAKSYIEQMDPADISKRMQIRKIIIYVVLILAAVMLLMWLAIIIIALANELSLANGYLVTHPAAVVE